MDFIKVALTGRRRRVSWTRQESGLLLPQSASSTSSVYDDSFSLHHESRHVTTQQQQQQPSSRSCNNTADALLVVSSSTSATCYEPAVACYGATTFALSSEPAAPSLDGMGGPRKRPKSKKASHSTHGALVSPPHEGEARACGGDGATWMVPVLVISTQQDALWVPPSSHLAAASPTARCSAAAHVFCETCGRVAHRCLCQSVDESIS